MEKVGIAMLGQTKGYIEFMHPLPIGHNSHMSVSHEDCNKEFRKKWQPLQRFATFDDKKFIQVRARLENSPYTIDRKVPILIPKKSPNTKLLIQEAQ